MDESCFGFANDFFRHIINYILSIRLAHMKAIIITIYTLCIALTISCSDKEAGNTSSTEDLSLNAKTVLAKCLSRKGWIMYSSYTCSACIAQKNLFGNAIKYIKEIECNPHAPDTKVGQCIENKIQITPTWIWKKEGQELLRIEKYQLLEDLALHSDCEF